MKFLEENAKKDGVVSLPSGVQYRVLKSEEGEGEKPFFAGGVTVHYEGRTMEGLVFDQSPPGEPATLRVAATIKGWQEILLLMEVGDKWEVYIPPALAYGESGFAGKFGPNEALIFTIEVVGIQLYVPTIDPTKNKVDLPSDEGGP